VAYELTLVTAGLLVLAGVIAGFINTLAGGGSFLTLPALMLLGIPADVANATNRVGVMLQSMEAVRGFRRHGMLPTQAIVPMLVPSVGGALLGALLASLMPVAILKPIMLGTLIAMALLMVVRPSVVAVAEGTSPLSPWRSPLGFFGLFAAGVYGGFLQAGVGFVLIAALAGALRYDLVRANALKMTATAIFTGVALTIFVVRGQVLWIPGLLLALGSVVGVRLSVGFALAVSQRMLSWFLFAMVVVSCLAVWFG
jgi:uncharacterized membrane protein YfcA